MTGGYTADLMTKVDFVAQRPELTITSSYVQSRVDSNTFTMNIPMPESTLTLCQSQLYPPRQGLRAWPQVQLTFNHFIFCRGYSHPPLPPTPKRKLPGNISGAVT